MVRTIATSLAAVLVLGTAAYAQSPAPGQWGKLAPMIEPNSETTATVAGGKLYFLGGYPNGRVSVKTVQVYDFAANTWTIGPPLPEVNNHGMSVTVDGIIYLIGGQTDPNIAYVDTVYALDPKAGQWVKKAPMPMRRSAAAPVVLDGKIYVAGGRPPFGQEFAVYDPKADAWEKLPNVPTPRNHIVGVALGGKIHVAGGRFGGGFQSDQTAVFEAYDPKTKQWSTAAPMLKPRSGMNAVMANGCWHVWGGEHKDGMHPDHDYYNPKTNTWTKLPDMPMPVHGVVGSAFVNGLIYVAGGGVTNGGSTGQTALQVYRPNVSCE